MVIGKHHLEEKIESRPDGSDCLLSLSTCSLHFSFGCFSSLFDSSFHNAITSIVLFLFSLSLIIYCPSTLKLLIFYYNLIFLIPLLSFLWFFQTCFRITSFLDYFHKHLPLVSMCTNHFFIPICLVSYVNYKTY